MNASQDYSELVRRFYDAALDDDGWVGVAEELKRQFDLSRVTIGWLRARPYPLVRDGLVSRLLHRDCDAYYERLFEDLGPENSFVPHLSRMRPGDVFGDHMLMQRSEFVRTTMFNEWFAPQGDHSAAFVSVEQGAAEQAFLGVQRGGPQPAFTARDEAALRAISQPLVHAFSIRRRLGDDRLRHRGIAYEQLGIGFAVTDRSGRMLLCNGLADQQFGAGLGLQVRRRRIETEHRSQLPSLIAAACAPSGVMPGGSVIVTHGDAVTPTFAVSVSPLRDELSGFELPTPRAAMLLIQPLASRLPEAFETRVKMLFGLTAREASLAVALSAGLSLAQAADERFISLATARTQLASIFRKTATTRQSQLVALLLRAVPVTP